MKNLGVSIFSFIIFLLTDSYSQNFWEQCTGLDKGLVRSVVVDSNDNIYAGMMRESLIYKSTDDGESWEQLVFLDDASIWSLMICPSNYLYAATNGGAGVYRSTDQGISWMSLDLGMQYNSVNDVTANKNKEIFAATDYGIYISRDEGETWILSADGIPNESIYTIEHDFPNNIIYAGTYSKGMYKSIDNGNSWIEINSGISYPYIYGLGVNRNGDVYSGADGVPFYKSTDQGNTWIELSDRFPSNTGPIPAIAFNSSGHIYIGMEWGVQCYCSTDHGITWKEKTSGLTSIGIWSIAINSYGVAFAGTHLHGIFKSTESTTSINRTEEQFLNDFVLQQNYPNPFNPSTKIMFKLPYPEKVKIEILNALGQKIKTLLNKHMSTGSHEVEFSAHNLSSGVYLYRIEAGRIQEVKKMLLIK